MGLKDYHAKRKFDDTPEPKGKPEAKTPGLLRFVVQKHAASHLHYDFRLEVDGVLKSWAVPKGPVLDPSIKRLAMQVEDHPLDYRLFEGTIPAGNYGAGTVMVWDEGSYSVSDDHGKKLSRPKAEARVIEGLKKGKLTFQIQGKKLQGEFALVKTHRDEKGWLLIKHDDEFATGDDILLEEYSVISKRSMEEIKENGTTYSTRQTDVSKKASKLQARKSTSDRESRKADSGPTDKGKELAKRAKKNYDPMPHQIKPMKATLVDSPFIVNH